MGPLRLGPKGGTESKQDPWYARLHPREARFGGELIPENNLIIEMITILFEYILQSSRRLNISSTCDSRNKTLSEGSRFRSVCLGIVGSSSSNNNSCQGTAAEALQLAKGPLLGPGSSEERKSFVVSRLAGTPAAASNGVPRRSA